MKNVPCILNSEIVHKRVLLRADFDVTLNDNLEIIDDLRIYRNIPTILHLLENGNKIICVAKLGRPTERHPKHSLKVVAARLQKYLDGKATVHLIHDFLTEKKETFTNQKVNEVLLLENIRFYPEEKKNDFEFAKKLGDLADVFVHDAFSMAHRTEASTVGITEFLPSYSGLLLKTEVEKILTSIKNPKRPLVVIVGGAKIKDKINFIHKLTEIADYILVGGGLANTFLASQGINMQDSLYEKDHLDTARMLLSLARKRGSKIVLPTDGVVNGHSVSVKKIPKNGKVLDIGPETMQKFESVIKKAKTIIWNGPMGKFEDPRYRIGTDFILTSIVENHAACSIVGGGDTLAAISTKSNLHKITHVSTGGGAMLELIEKGTLPVLEALKKL